MVYINTDLTHIYTFITFDLILSVMGRVNNHHAISVTPSYHLSNLLFPCFTPSCYQWLGQKVKRKVSYCLHFLATWFMLHTAPNKQCLDRPFISPKSLENINIHCSLQSFLGIFLTFISPGEVCWTCFLFLRYNLLHICIDSHVHTRELPISPSHAFPLFGRCAAPLEQLGGCSWFKDTSAVDEGGECFSFAFPTQIFPDILCLQTGVLLVTSLLLILFISPPPFSR